MCYPTGISFLSTEIPTNSFTSPSLLNSTKTGSRAKGSNNKILYGFCSVVSADCQTPLFSDLSTVHQDSLASKYIFSLRTSTTHMPDLLLEAAYVNKL